MSERLDHDHSEEKQGLNNRIDGLISDKIRMDSLKRDVENELMGVAIENQGVERQIDEKSQERTQMMIELDKVIALFEQAEKDKDNLVTKIQVLMGVQEEKFELIERPNATPSLVALAPRGFEDDDKYEGGCAEKTYKLSPHTRSEAFKLGSYSKYYDDIYKQ